MKLLNEGFDEKILGYKSWKNFTKDAISMTNVIQDEDNISVFEIDTKAGKNRNQETPEIFRLLLQAIENNDWTTFNSVGKKLIAKEIFIKDYGYSKLKNLIIDAEKRNFVETKNVGSSWSLKKLKYYKTQEKRIAKKKGK